MKRESTILLIAMCSVVSADDNQFKVLEHDAMRLAAPKIRITMKQAVETASTEVTDGKLEGAVLGEKGELPIFEVEFITNDGYIEVTVDAISGKVLGKDLEKIDASEAAEFKAESKALNAAQFTLSQALELSSSKVKSGTLVYAKSRIGQESLHYEVEVLSDEDFKEVRISLDGGLLEFTAANDVGQSWIFDREEAGKPPIGWKPGFTNPAGGNAKWTVAKDTDAPTGPNVLTLAAQSENKTFNVALAENTSYKDVNLRTRIRADTGKLDRGGGLIWRAKDENNYYLCRLNPLESNFRLYRVVNGKRDEIQGAKVKGEPGKWYVLRAKMIGNHIMCFLGERKMLDATDDSIKNAGMIGLWTKSDASSSFDNMAVAPAVPNAKDALPRAVTPAEAKEKDEDDDDDDGD